MGIIKCKECEKEISDQAKKCPNCGVPIPKLAMKLMKLGCSVMILMIVFPILIVVIMALMNML